MLNELDPEQVAEIIEASFGASPIPCLTDPAARQRARETARRHGLAERIEVELTADEPIPVVPYTRFRDYRLNGNRTRCQAIQSRRTRQMELAALACLLGQDYRDYLHDLLWAECESTWWVMAAHERHGTPIDLRAALTACQCAVILTALRDEIEPEVRERVLDEIQRRVLRPYLSDEHRHAWKTSTNNWNAVCIGSVLITAMLLETEGPRLGRIVADGLTHLESFLAGFAPDGGCTEGPSYWRFGFGWYIRLAAALHEFTGGRIDIGGSAGIGAIARYPLSVVLAPGRELTFADAHAGFQDPVTVRLINRFHDVPGLYGLCRLRGDGEPELDSLESLLLYDGWTARPLCDGKDHFLAGLGLALVRAGGTSLGAKAGHNAEHHNHNDVGSFLVFRDGVDYLTDPGAPVYSAATFSARRYESIFCNSLGHSVPVIDGRQQPAGRQFAGRIEVDGKAVRIEMARAYDGEPLKRLGRVLELLEDGAEVRLADVVEFDGAPRPVEEAFITTHPVEIAADGSSVTIRPDGAPPATLSADGCAGRFALREFLEESKAEARTGEVVRRITFTPATLAASMTLSFVLRFGR